MKEKTPIENKKLPNIIEAQNRFSTESVRGEVRDISKEQKLTSHTVQTKEKSSRSEIHLITRSATLFPREGTVADSSGKEECGVSPECPDRGKETLEQRLTRLIAEHDGVSPEEVTGEYIEKQRQERIYPTTRYDISSLYGGYHPKNITVYTGNEIEELKKRVSSSEKVL